MRRAAHRSERQRDLLPATVTARYHFDLGGARKPYRGAGPALFMILREGVGSNAAELGTTEVNLPSEPGFALQAGMDVKLNDLDTWMPSAGLAYRF